MFWLCNSNILSEIFSTVSLVSSLHQVDTAVMIEIISLCVSEPIGVLRSVGAVLVHYFLCGLQESLLVGENSCRDLS